MTMNLERYRYCAETCSRNRPHSNVGWHTKRYLMRIVHIVFCCCCCCYFYCCCSCNNYYRFIFFDVYNSCYLLFFFLSRKIRLQLFCLQYVFSISAPKLVHAFWRFANVYVSELTLKWSSFIFSMLFCSILA